MKYEVKSKKDKKTVVAYTESPVCIGSLDEQRSLLAAGYKIVFSGTQKEYDKLQKKLDKHVTVRIE